MKKYLFLLTFFIPLAATAACTTNYWQLQQVKFPPSGGTSSGRTTGATPSAGNQGFTSCEASPTKPLPSFDFGNVGYMGHGNIPTKAATKTYPAGRIEIKHQLVLKSGEVLSGAGRDKTILYFPNGLKQMGFLCRNGEKITMTGGGTGDCFDWPSGIQFMGVIGMEGSETGIEDLTIEFPDHGWQHYGNYNYTSGYNGIDLKQCNNCWVKNVTIKKTDNGIFVNRGSNNTLDGVHVYGNGHMHIGYVATKNALTKNFRMYGSSAHGLVMNWGTENSVFANGWGENIVIEPDHGCNNTNNNPCNKNMLYSNINGKIRSFQTTNRGQSTPIQTLYRWNVGAVDRCPLDVYTAQH
jgi:parallel beta-helix repeat protein